MHSAQSRRPRHEVPVFRHGVRVGTVRPRVMGRHWIAEMADGLVLGSLFASVRDAEAAIVNHARGLEG